MMKYALKMMKFLAWNILLFPNGGHYGEIPRNSFSCPPTPIKMMKYISQNRNLGT